MTLCKFYLQGTCRFGDSCRFEHRPPKPHEPEYNEWRRNNPSSFSSQTSGFGTSNADDNHATRKGWSEQIIYDNLKTERPTWPFTSFGAPFFRSLIQADLSFEEYHLACVEAQRNGTFPQWQQECDRRIAEIKAQEENVLRNLKAAWQYNVNEPYYPAGKLESENNASTGSAFGGQASGFGGGTTSAFGTTGQSSTGGGTSSFGKPAASFGSSPFGSMPASAFSLGSRDSSAAQSSAFGSSPSAFGSTPSAFGSAPSAFGNNTTTSAFGQQNKSAFGAPTTSSAFRGGTSAFGSGTTSTTSAFGSPSTGTTSAFGGTSTSAFGAKPSAFGTTSSLPTVPSVGLSSTPTFGQTSTLGASGLPPPPGTGFASTPTFGQTSGLGALGSGSTAPTFGQTSALGAMAGNAAPAFGQTSSFSSPFSGGLGRSLGGAGTFGAKSTFGSFGQGNQPSAFTQAAGMGQTSGFLGSGNQASSGSRFAAPAPITTGSSAFGGGNRFTVLSGSGAAGDKDDEMADSTPTQEKLAPFSPPPGPTPGPTIRSTQPLPPSPAEPAATPGPPPTLPSQPASTSSLTNAFGGLSTKPAATPAPARPFGQPGPTPTLPAGTSTVPTTPPPKASTASRMSAQDEMAAWMASEFTIGMIPETEPPLEVR